MAERQDYDFRDMNITTLSDDAEKKVRTILARRFEPRPVQAIADEIQRSYDETLQYLVHIGETLPIRFTNIPDGLQAVEVVVGSRKKTRG